MPCYVHTEKDQCFGCLHVVAQLLPSTENVFSDPVVTFIQITCLCMHVRCMFSYACNVHVSVGM